MELSIIVPVYNVEEYLERCLNSLVHQTLSKSQYEIIIVNDGSTDCSQDIIDRFVHMHENIKGYEKANGGLSDARNYGIIQASGKYLTFVDSDDFVEETMYEVMLKKAFEKEFDIVVCDFIEEYDDHSETHTSLLNEDIFTQQGIKHAMCDIYPSAWNKLYRSSLFEHVSFKKGVWFEDVECLYRLFPYVKSIGVVHQPFYHYIQRVGSISKSKDNRIFHCVDNWNGIIEYYQEHNNWYKQYKKEIEYSYVRYLYATFIKASLKYDREAYNVAVHTALKEVKKHVPQYRRNSYFYTSIKGWYLVCFNRYLAYLLYLLKGQKG